MLNIFVHFHTGKGGVFIDPNSFKIGAKKCHILGFRGTGDTTVIIGQYSRLQSDTERYHRLIEVGDRALTVPPPDKGGTTAGSINYQWYHRLVWAVPSPRPLGRMGLPVDATVGHDFRG